MNHTLTSPTFGPGMYPFPLPKDISDKESHRWYNSTYTLYAGMIILYVILLNYTKIPGEELLSDVEKSHKILRAMKEATVRIF